VLGTGARLDGMYESLTCANVMQVGSANQSWWLMECPDGKGCDAYHKHTHHILSVVYILRIVYTAYTLPPALPSDPSYTICDFWFPPFVISDFRHCWFLISSIADFWFPPFVICDLHVWYVIVVIMFYLVSISHDDEPSRRILMPFSIFQLSYTLIDSQTNSLLFCTCQYVWVCRPLGATHGPFVLCCGNI
jgi:hypothetical protein